MGLTPVLSASCVQDKDLIVNGLKKQIKQMVQFSQQAPQAKLMEPLTNQPVSSFEFAFKIRVSGSRLADRRQQDVVGDLGHCCACTTHVGCNRMLETSSLTLQAPLVWSGRSLGCHLA
jgi:hypothetical protein